MLRITVHEESTVWRLSLSGKLAGPWVAETENVWRAMPRASAQIEIDLKEVTGVDTAGRMLLAAMHRAGAQFVTGGVANSALVSEISRGRHLRKASDPKNCRECACPATQPERNQQ